MFLARFESGLVGVWRWLRGGPAPGGEKDLPPDGSASRSDLRPRPLAFSIPWRPAQGDGGDHVGGEPHELFVAQPVFESVLGHVPVAPGEQRYGYLFGRRFRCPATGDPYVLIDEAWLASHPLSERHGSGFFEESLREAEAEAASSEREVVGWFHNHSVLMGVRLSEQDLRLHHQFFREPWHVALLIVPHPRQPLGGFLRRTDAHRYPGIELIPFYEVVDEEGATGWSRMDSVVNWQNYWTPRFGVRIVTAPPGAPEVTDGLPPKRVSARGPEEPRPPEAESKAAESRAAGGTATEPGGDSRPAGEPPERGFELRPPEERRKPDRHEPEAATDSEAAAPAAETAGPEPPASPATTEETGAWRPWLHTWPPGPPAGAETTRTGESPVPEPAPASDPQPEAPSEAAGEPTELAPSEEPEPAPTEELTPTEEPEPAPTEEPEPAPTEELTPTEEPEPAPTEEPEPAPTEEPEPAPTQEQPTLFAEAEDPPVEPGRSETPVAETEPTTVPGLPELRFSFEPSEPTEDGGRLEHVLAGLTAAVASRHGTRSVVPGARAPVRTPAEADRGPRPADAPAEIPVVLPPPDRLDERLLPLRLAWRRNGRWVIGLMAVATIGYGLLQWLSPDSGRVEPPPRAGAPRGQPPSVATGRFRGLAEALEAALAAYNERQGDYRLGRIDCQGLSLGMDEVRRRAAALSEYVARFEARLSLAEKAQHGRLLATVATADSAFEASGCPPAGGDR